jgi:hypothetical protein
MVEFLPTDDPEARLFAADIIGYLCGYAHLINTRLLALPGAPDASPYELLFAFAAPTGTVGLDGVCGSATGHITASDKVSHVALWMFFILVLSSMNASSGLPSLLLR